jgi:hypothetical protein
MATIGTKTAASNTAITDHRAYIHNLSAFHYTPSVAEEVFEVGIYGGNSTSGKEVEITIRDITGGLATATVMQSIAVTGGSGTNQWYTTAVDPPLQLTAGHTYAVDVWIKTGAWEGRRAGVAWGQNNSLYKTGQSSVPTDYSSSTGNNLIYAFYADTRTSTESGGPSTHSIEFSEECASSDFALGMTATKNKAGTPVVADSVVALTQGITRPAGDSVGDAANTVLYTVTYSDGPPVDGDTLHFDYDKAVGDIAATAAGNKALETGERSATVCT